MFCPSCGALAFPRKGKDSKSYFRVHSEKKPKEDFKAEMARWEELEPLRDDFQNSSEFREESEFWSYNKPSEFFIEELGDEFEENGKDYIQCPNPECAFHGPADKVEKRFMNTKSKTASVSRKYEVIKDSDNRQGILTTGDYMCPKCDCVEVYAYLEQTRSSDEPETRMLTCKNCGNGWREY